MSSLIRILFFFSWSCFAVAAQDEFSTHMQELAQDVEAQISRIDEAKHSGTELTTIEYKLKRYQQVMNACIKNESAQLQELKNHEVLIAIKTQIPFLQQQQEKFQTQIKLHQDRQQYCQFLEKQIDLGRTQLSLNLYHKFKENLSVPEKNLFETIKHLNVSSIDWTYKKNLDAQHFLLQAIAGFLFCLAFVFLCKGLDYFNLNPVFKMNVSSAQIYYASGLFILSNSFIYHIVSFEYTNVFDLPLNLYSRSGIRVLFFIMFLFYVKRLPLVYPKRDYFILLAGLFELGGLVYIAGQINYLEMQQQGLNNIYALMFWKYAYLMLLALVTATNIYLISKYVPSILPTESRFCRYYAWVFSQKTLCIVSFFALLFLLACLGYLDLAISVWFMVLISHFLLLNFFIFVYQFNCFISEVEHPKHYLGRLFAKYLLTSTSQRIMELRSLSFLMKTGLFFIIVEIVWVLCYLPEDIFFRVYNFVYQSTQAANQNLIFIHILMALALFLILNLINRFVSSYMGKKIGRNSNDDDKYQKILYSLGLLLSAVICLKIAKIEFKSLGFILGGLSFGLGIGLRDLIGNFIAGLILMVANPVSKGHYVIVGDVRGFVKKISLMETYIESFDKINIIIPNLRFLQSIVQNYSSSKTRLPRFHFKFMFKDINHLSAYKNIILTVISKEKDVIMTGPLSPEFMVFPGSNPHDIEEIELDLGFCVHHIENLFQVISNLTQNLIYALKAADMPVYLRSTGLPQK